jgi:hypothetical protein
MDQAGRTHIFEAVIQRQAPPKIHLSRFNLPMMKQITSKPKTPGRHFLHTTAKLQYALPSALDGTLMRWDDGRCYWRDGERDGYIVDLLNRDRFDFRVIQLFGNEVVEFPELIGWEPNSWPELAEHGMLPCVDPFAIYEFERRYPKYRGRQLRAHHFGYEAYNIWAGHIFGPTWQPEESKSVLQKAQSLGARIQELNLRPYFPVTREHRRRFEVSQLN